MEEEEDGYSGSVSIVRDNVEDVYHLASVFEESANIMGFTYVKRTIFECEDGTIIRSDI